jgi:drug/metabolite transporter (DMT)-like permease
VLAAAAGVGFGVFQTLNRRGVGGIPDAYISTFVQLVVALVVLGIATAATEDLGVLGDASAASLVYFSLAGLVHFFVGWTFLNMSQMRIGAARTSPLLATTPMFGAALAAVTLAELPAATTWIGVALVTGGALLVSATRVTTIGWGVGWRDSAPGVGAALAWAVSPLFIKEGLESLPSPLIGLTLGMAVSVGAYAAALPFRPRLGGAAFTSRAAVVFKLAAGVMVGLSVWARWVALDHTTVAVVLALGLLSVPVVLVFSPVLMGREVERVTLAVWAGGALVVGGGLLLVLASS